MKNKLLRLLNLLFLLSFIFPPQASAQSPSPQDPRAVGLTNPIDVPEEEIVIQQSPAVRQPFEVILADPLNKFNFEDVYKAQNAFISMAEAELEGSLEVLERDLIDQNSITINLLKSEAKMIMSMDGVLSITRLESTKEMTTADSSPFLETLNILRDAPLPITKTVSQDLANPGDTLIYTITIPSNRTGADLNYDIQDTLPTGVTYYPNSIRTSGTAIPAVYDELTDTITWSGTMPDFDLRYEMSDNTTNPDYCKMPSPMSTDGGYVDILTRYGTPTKSDVYGDGIAFTLNLLGIGTEYFGDMVPYRPYFTDDGYVLMNEPENYKHPYTYKPNTSFPDPDEPNGVVSLWWRDMYIRYAYDEVLNINKGVTAQYFTSAWLVEFDDIEGFYNDLTMDFEVFAWQKPNPEAGWPDIIFAYDNVESGWDADGSIGIENADGSMGYTYAYDDDVPQNGDIVCFDYVEVGRDPVVITFAVTLNDILETPENEPGTVITNTAAYTVNEGATEYATASFTINDVPVADPQTLETNEDTPLSITLSGSDTYPGEPLIYKITQPDNGKALADGSLPNLIYTSNPNFSGTDSFTFTVGDGLATSSPATITITVAPVDDPPVLSSIPDQQIEELTTLSFTATASDPDLPKNLLSFSLLDPPSGAEIDPSSGIFTWTPTAEQGPNIYEVTIQVCDDGDPILCNQEDVSITVTEPREFVYLPLIIK